jgi:hypothetical protein
VQARIAAFADAYGSHYPTAVKCLLTDREQLTSYLRFPREHHRRVRHSNFIERTFGETRRRVKVIGRLPGVVSCLSLVWAVLDRASRGWRGFTMTSDGTRQLQDLRRAARATDPTPPEEHGRHRTRRKCRSRRLTCPPERTHVRRFTPDLGRDPGRGADWASPRSVETSSMRRRRWQSRDASSMRTSSRARCGSCGRPASRSHRWPGSWGSTRARWATGA